MSAVNTGAELQMIIRATFRSLWKNVELLGMKEIPLHPKMR